jgi:hypothetical protein
MRKRGVAVFPVSTATGEPSLFVRHEQLTRQHPLEVVCEGVGERAERTIGDAASRVERDRAE